MSYRNKQEALASIRRNIEKHGHHVYIVGQGTTPRFAYTIGLRESVGTELVLAGAIVYDADEVLRILSSIADKLRERKSSSVRLFRLGTFELRAAHESWTRQLLLGALDYYKGQDVAALQLVPDDKHWTIDVPDMRAAWNAQSEPGWRWLQEKWTYPVPDTAECMTSLAVLRGEAVTEAARWEENYWELFPDTDGEPPPDKEARLVPIGCVIGADPSLEAVLSFRVGEAKWRESRDDDWRAWDQ
jgi:hypothetical protein